MRRLPITKLKQRMHYYNKVTYEYCDTVSNDPRSERKVCGKGWNQTSKEE